MASLTKQNLKVLQDAVREGLISPSLANDFADRSARGKIGLRDLQFILSLMKQMTSMSKFKLKK